jgi:hypothetical protein
MTARMQAKSCVSVRIMIGISEQPSLAMFECKVHTEKLSTKKHSDDVLCSPFPVPQRCSENGDAGESDRWTDGFVTFSLSRDVDTDVSLELCNNLNC